MNADIQPGVKVQWTKVTRKGKSINFSARKGIVVQIGTGYYAGEAEVKLPNGRKEWVEIKALETATRRGPLTRMFFPEQGDAPEVSK